VLLATTLLLKFLDVLVELLQVLSLDAKLLFEFFQAMYAVSMRNDIPVSEVLPLHLLLPNELVLRSCFSLCEGITVRREGERSQLTDSPSRGSHRHIMLKVHKLTPVPLRRIL
jgi:hypothetical protein